jgi:hypothetical protein
MKISVYIKPKKDRCYSVKWPAERVGSECEKKDDNGRIQSENPKIKT